MYIVKKTNGIPNDSLYKEFFVETVGEIQSLPTDKSIDNKCAVGSEALCLENKTVYILGFDSVWHEL